MTERKPAGVSFESWVDAQIREARERGEFDNLPGAGKPLTDLDGNHDDMWWIRQWLKREEIGFTPPAIALRRAVEDTLANIGKLLTERAVRNVVDELNGRIRELNRIPPIDGPPSSLMPLDVEAVLERWHAARVVIEATTPSAEPAPHALVTPEGPRHERLLTAVRRLLWRA